MHYPPLTPSVLIASDDIHFTGSLQLAFQKESPGLPINFLSDGPEVVDYLQQCLLPGNEPSKPAILLLDRNLPLMDAFQILQWLITVPELKPRHSIILGTEELHDDRPWALGADAYLVKASTFGDLCAQVRELLLLLHSQPEPAATA